MSDIKYIQVQLNKLFNFKKGTNEFNKTTIEKNKGANPVYSGQAQNDGIIGYTCIKQYSGDYIRIITVGEAGKMSIASGDFCLAQNNGILMPLPDVDIYNIDLRFIIYQLESVLPDLAKGEGKQKSLLKRDIDECILTFPIDEFGNYNLAMQREIADKYETIINKRNQLLKYKEKLEKSLIETYFAQLYNHKEFLISELFTPTRGTGKYTKTLCNQHKGEYPVFSSNTKEIFSLIDTYDYDGNYITWSTDGLAGYIFVTDGKFSATDHRGILIPNEETDVDNLDMDYLKYVIEPIFRKNIKGRMGHDGQNEYTSLKLNAVSKITQKIPIPVKKDGSFDFEAQKEIAKKYEKLYEVKKGICSKIEHLTSINISLMD